VAICCSRCFTYCSLACRTVNDGHSNVVGSCFCADSHIGAVGHVLLGLQVAHNVMRMLRGAQTLLGLLRRHLLKQWLC
jgi:hypothetical protein